MDFQRKLCGSDFDAAFDLHILELSSDHSPSEAMTITGAEYVVSDDRRHVSASSPTSSSVEVSRCAPIKGPEFFQLHSPWELISVACRSQAG
jgi:hypothetical protein